MKDSIFILEKCQSVVEVSDEIEKLFCSQPDKRKKKDFDLWKKTINLYIKKANELAKFKIYTPVK